MVTERSPKTLVDEFYAVAFRKKRYERSEELQLDLDNVMDSYNYRRTHQGYRLKKNGYRIPTEAHLQKKLTSNKKSAIVKTRESIRGEKGVEENLPFACVLSASTITIVWEARKQPFGRGTIFSIIFISIAVLITLSFLTPSPEESRLSRFFSDSFSSQQSNKHMRGI